VATVGNAPQPPNGIQVEAATKTGGASSGTNPSPTPGQIATGGVAGATGARGLEKPDAPPQTPDFGGPVERPEAMQAKRTHSATDARRDIQMQDAAGGHTIERHVGKSEAWLRKRLENDPDIGNFASSFHNEAIANRVQGRIVNRFQNQIQEYLKSGQKRPLVIEVDMREPVGILVERGKSGSITTTKATVVIARDQSKQGWHFATSYPSK
jgi:hypothetical protein